MPYTLRFSDGSKTDQVIVPDMPPGINTVDTSLSLVGRGYPNYGEKIASNFLHLLENFASPLPPENPIEGQLWYDTRDPNNKVLRIMDGTADSTRWPSANGIYQQGTDPKLSASPGLKVGDIWVDTSANQLKIYNSDAWTVVGPSTSVGLSKTGTEPSTIIDVNDISHNVIVNYVNGNVVAIVSDDEEFIPREVIEGFTTLKPGITLSTKNLESLTGPADSALSLEISGLKYSSDRFLRKDDTSFTGQIITGKVFFQTPVNQVSSQGRDGVLINTTLLNSEYIQLYKLSNDAVLLNNTPGGKIIFKTKPDPVSGLVSGMTIENRSVAINTVTNSNYALDIFGSLRVAGDLVLSSTSSSVINVYGSFSIEKNLQLNTGLIVKGNTTATGLITVGSTSSSGTIIIPSRHDSYDIGSTSKYFRSLYVSSIGSVSSGTSLYGRVIGSATRLESSTEFKLQGQVTATSFLFSGTQVAATFNTAITDSAITAQAELWTATSTLTVLAIDTSTSATYRGLRKISRENFLSGIFPVGMITAYGGNLPPQGWLFCDGSSTSTSIRTNLYNVIGYTYGGSGPNFNLPDMRHSTTSTMGYINYIIKT